MLDQARGLGTDPVLVVCAAGNLASARTIERCGGVLDDVQDTGIGQVRRYRFALR
jgi:predicted acetyltransferase